MSMRQVPDYLFLDSGATFGQQNGGGCGQAANGKVLDQYELPLYDLAGAGHKYLIIDEFVDQEMLYEERSAVAQFLDQGNIVIFCGHLFRAWLPGAGIFLPKAIHSHLDYNVEVLSHPIFEGVLSEDLTFNRGVSGFFARGHHPLPEGAEVLLRLAGGEPITYIDRQSSGGTILLHSGRNLLGYRGWANSARRIAPQLERFLDQEHRQLQAKGEQPCGR
ncbi:hypothetical protein PA598K_05476 [Paenibacillus sp. 598K]|uniref:phosphate starvation-inducible protein PhoH n=1 Tax=Paenibacillus sp. 598K TaxID=1117987 RepID=UPI000FF91EAE|nr:phosphate starvation-inducible protein PhoH [Paenibacillus sp. 598K]GBF76958.1 hypothetical protein PA598K_05476 [Paenibacillus sp. 598K]